MQGSIHAGYAGEGAGDRGPGPFDTGCVGQDSGGWNPEPCTLDVQDRMQQGRGEGLRPGPFSCYMRHALRLHAQADISSAVSCSRDEDCVFCPGGL